MPCDAADAAADEPPMPPTRRCAPMSADADTPTLRCCRLAAPRRRCCRHDDAELMMTRRREL